MDPLRKQEATPLEIESLTAPDMMDGVNASVVPPRLEHTTEIITFTHEDMETLQRFLGRIMPTSETDSRATALELAHQLQKLTKKYVENLARRRYERSGLNPNRPEVGKLKFKT